MSEISKLNEKVEELYNKYLEVNERYFGLEGRMSRFESINILEKANQEKFSEQLLKAMNENAERIHKMELRIATYVGGLAVLGIILKLLVK